MKNSLGPILFGIFAVCICYIYFLTFAQFSFLELVKEHAGIQSINTIMGIMGTSGIAFSLFAIRLLKIFPANILIRIGFFGCALSCITSLWAGFSLLCISSFLIGAFLAILTVALASSLSTLFPTSQLGLLTGIGTGLAYFTCNVPALFQASSIDRAIFSASLCLVMVLAPHPKGVLLEKNASVRLYKAKSYSAPLLFLLVFTTLVWFDSSAFYIIQQSSSYKEITWHGSFRLWINAFVHLISALVAGHLIDRRHGTNLLLSAYILLALAIGSLNNIILTPYFASVFYCAGVSIYSTALVLAPSLFIDNKYSLEARHRAGILYAIAGWLGSALGIGMAQDLHVVPLSFVVLAGLSLLLFKFKIKNLIIQSCAMLFVLLSYDLTLATDKIIEAGRDTYISEGCINCHSQYIRPIGRDIELWGPYVDYSQILMGVPPLIGNRRQGPDLLNVGNRRNREWLKLHFFKPRDLVPWSRMPSYAYLFKNSQGDELLDYLESLGKETILARSDFIKSWLPNNHDSESNIPVESLYLTHCAQCHGGNGSGSGPLAEELSVRPRVLNRRPYYYVDFNSPNVGKELARIIKFGIFGTSMAGHEYFSDAEIRSLVIYLENMSK